MNSRACCAILPAVAVAVAVAVAIGGGPTPAAAQSSTSRSHGADFSGVWTNQNLPGTSDWSIYTFTEEPPRLTEWGRARFAERRPQRGPNGVPVAETNDPVYECFPPGTPRIYIHPFPVEIIQTPGRVLMHFEYDQIIRQIFTDGREHALDLSPSWMGDSIGHWEDDVLVVETLNFNDKTWVTRHGIPHSEEMVLTERIHLNDAGLLQIDMQIDDPVALAEPWRFTRYFRKTDWTIAEFMCIDNATYKAFEDTLLEYDDAAE